MALDLTFAVHHKRSVARLLMPDSCDVVRLTETQTSGGVTVVETTIATGVPLFYTEDLIDQDQVQAESLGVQITAVARVPAETDVAAADRLAITVDGVSLGTYEVTAVVRQTWEILRFVYLKGPL